MDKYCVHSDVNVCSEDGMGDNINVDTDIFTRNESQDYVDGVVDVDVYVVIDAVACDDVNVNAECSFDGYGVRSDVNVSSVGDVGDNSNVGTDIIFTGNKRQSNVSDGDDIDNVDEYVVLDAFVCYGISVCNGVEANADCNVDGDGVRCDVNVTPECDVGGDVNVDYEVNMNNNNSGFNENNVDNEEGNDVNSDCDVNNENDTIVISSEEEFDEMLIISINLTLSKTEKYKDGKVQSVSRTALIGYSENLSEMDIKENVKNIFDYVQNEFTEYAKYYHDLKKQVNDGMVL